MHRDGSSRRPGLTRSLTAFAGALALIGVYGLSSGGRDGKRSGDPPSSPPAIAAAKLRDLALQHARTRLGDVDAEWLTTPYPDPGGTLTGERVSCQFVERAPSGTSDKFDCALPDGEVVKVKYGHQPEIHAEVAATRLLTALGYAADHMYLVPFLRCYGCPWDPFLTMRLVDLTGRDELYPDDQRRYTDFQWVAVERKFEAPAIEDQSRKGWAWWELKHVQAPVADLDELRLLAVFLAHWDNKEENQRLVCLDAHSREDAPCGDSLLMLQDVGATFGPMKVNLAQWSAMPIWSDRATCSVSMRTAPFAGATFADARITEEARLRVGGALASFSDADLRAWFAAARFPEFYPGTEDRRDLEMWTRAFHHRVAQILSAGPCPQ